MEKKLIRIFISSTFNDFAAERDILAREVFPKIKKDCQKRGITFQAVDLRWGITYEEAAQQDTMRICLDEIDKCQTVSPRPNFFLLLGNRYGWEALPPEIPQDIGDRLVLCLKKMPADRDKCVPYELFQLWYKIDYNKHEAHDTAQHFYVLQAETDEGSFEAISFKLLDMLRFASDKAGLIDEEKSMFFQSATAREIEKGIEKVATTNNESVPFICYYREICDIDKYTDVDEVKKKALEALKERIKHKCKDSFFEQKYTTIPTDESSLKDFAHNSYIQLKSLIDVRIIEFETEKALYSHEENEKNIHKIFATERRECFVGRREVLDKIDAYVKNSASQLFVLYGDGGIGKSAVMAKAVQEIATDIESKKNSRLIYRFVGASSFSCDAYALVQSLYAELQEDTTIASAVSSLKPSSSYQNVCELFRLLLLNIPKEKHITICVDAIDQLTVTGYANPLAWLPIYLPENISFIVSTLEENLVNVKNLFRGVAQEKLYCEHLPGLLAGEGLAILRSLLQKKYQSLTAVQNIFLNNYFTVDEVYGLYIRMLFEEVRHWKSYDMHYALPTTLPDFIEYFFSSIAENKRHGKAFTQRLLGYLAITHQGIAEEEILTILADDEDVKDEIGQRFPFWKDNMENLKEIPFILWARFYSDIGSYLKIVSANGNMHYQFYHRLLEKYVVDTFLSKKCITTLHCHLSSYFQKQFKDFPHKRVLMALPYHLRLAGKTKELYDLLLDKSYFHAKYTAELLYDYLSEAMWVFDSMQCPQQKNEFLEKLFAIIALFYDSQKVNDDFWSYIHSFIIYGKNKPFHEMFFNNAASVEVIKKKFSCLSHGAPEKIYRACFLHRANYYRRITDLESSEKIILQGFQHFFSYSEKMELFLLDNELSAIATVLKEKDMAVPFEGSDKLEQQINEALAHEEQGSILGKIFYEFGFIQFFKNNRESAINNMFASAYISAIKGNDVGKYISCCVGHHFQAFYGLYTEKKDKYMDEYKEMLEEARVEFEKYADENEHAKRWLQANTIEHLGFVAAYQNDENLLQWCVAEYENSPWVQRTDDKSNLFFMQARYAHIKANTKEEYESACKAMQDFIAYKKELTEDNYFNIEHLAQYYLLLGDSYQEAGDSAQAKTCWEQAKALPPNPGNGIWKDEAARRV